MEIAERDQKIIRIREAMKANQNHILQKMRQLEQRKEENPYLVPIYMKYKNSNDHNVEQKQKQLLQMQKLLDYLDETINKGRLTTSTYEHAKKERSRVLTTLDKVQKELDILEGPNHD